MIRSNANSSNLCRSLFMVVATIPVTLGSIATPQAANNDAGLPSRADRINARAQVERFYYELRIWPTENPGAKPPFESVMPASEIERLVDDASKLSRALAQIWQTPIGPARLQAELDRIAQNTRYPRHLDELFAMLDHDPALIAEVIARPVLVERLARRLYALDPRFHGVTKDVAELEYSAIRHHGLLSGDAPTAHRNDVRISLRGSSSEEESYRRSLATRAGIDVTARTRVGTLSSLREDLESYTAYYVRASNDDYLELVELSWMKRSFDDWWRAASRDFEAGELPEKLEQAQVDEYRLPEIQGASEPDANCGPNAWSRLYSGAPDPRERFVTVWTGSEMLVWGGSELNPGMRYNPAIDAWSPMTRFGNPPNINYSTAVWTGTEAIVWGGQDRSFIASNLGGRYNPATDSWQPTSTGLNLPPARAFHTAVWTGTEMVVWGGGPGNTVGTTGGRYNPQSDSWAATSTGANVPSRRQLHTAVWTGSKMLIWGGEVAGPTVTNTGASYDPQSDSWAPIPITAQTPAARSGQTAVWTGSQMIVWGGTTSSSGSSSDWSDTGGTYSPSSGVWAATSTGANHPTKRVEHTAVWTGSEMIIWGGHTVNEISMLERTNSGGKYNPVSDSWTSTAKTGSNVPAGRRLHGAVWTGSEMIVWGGEGDTPSTRKTGGRYNPASNSWARVDESPEVPSPRSEATAVWTGAEMIVWGGDALNSGAHYNPITDSWTPTGVGSNLPSGRRSHSAVWTGTEMIVWGGSTGFPSLNTGGRYNPVTKSWTPTSLIAAPEGRGYHSAVWSGTEMIVFGGYFDPGGSHQVTFNSGGRYNPSSDTWTATSTGLNCPSPRRGHAAVWTGSAMLIWGGGLYPLGTSNTGGLYSPATDSWSAMTTAGAPSARTGMTAVWTGTQAVVWGGGDGVGSRFNSGGRYTPATDVWLPTSVGAAVPSGRDSHTAVWTGSEMIVWGGNTAAGATDTGGRYAPASDSWSATVIDAGTPLPRYRHVSVWTGTRMIAWGGETALAATSTGGSYFPTSQPQPTWFRDLDRDGFGDPTVSQASCQRPAGYVANSADCNDINSTIFPSAPQVCDGLNNDCGDPAFPTPPANDRDLDGDGFRPCNGDCNDGANNTYPGALEICNGLDEDCDGTSDNDAAGVDSDSDGVRNACDNCPAFANPNQADIDLDGRGNACDNCLTTPNPTQTDSDADTVGDLCDNCQTSFNPTQQDQDSDSIGDVCDNCLTTQNQSQHDFNLDGEGDECDLNDGIVIFGRITKPRVRWQTDPAYVTFNLYRGALSVLRSGGPYTQTPGSNPYAARFCGLTSAFFDDTLIPTSGESFYWLVTGRNASSEGSLGEGDTVNRPNANPCP